MKSIHFLSFQPLNLHERKKMLKFPRANTLGIVTWSSKKKYKSIFFKSAFLAWTWNSSNRIPGQEEETTTYANAHDASTVPVYPSFPRHDFSVQFRKNADSSVIITQPITNYGICFIAHCRDKESFKSINTNIRKRKDDTTFYAIAIIETDEEKYKRYRQGSDDTHHTSYFAIHGLNAPNQIAHSFVIPDPRVLGDDKERYLAMYDDMTYIACQVTKYAQRIDKSMYEKEQKTQEKQQGNVPFSVYLKQFILCSLICLILVVVYIYVWPLIYKYLGIVGENSMDSDKNYSFTTELDKIIPGFEIGVWIFVFVSSGLWLLCVGQGYGRYALSTVEKHTV